MESISVTPTTTQAIRQARFTACQWPQPPSRASLCTSLPILRTLHLSVHCLTMLGHIVYSLIVYMHNGQSRSIGKATNKRRTNDYSSPKKRACFPTILLLSTHFLLFRRIDHVC